MRIARTPREALIEPVRVDLALVPVNEHRIDGHQSEPPPHAQRCQQVGFAQSDHGDVEGAADFQEAGFLKMSDDEAVIARALGFECVADRLRGAAEIPSADGKGGRVGRARAPRI